MLLFSFCPRNCALTVFCRYFPLFFPPFFFLSLPLPFFLVASFARVLLPFERESRYFSLLSIFREGGRESGGSLSRTGGERDGMRNVARFASELVLAGSLYAAVTISITFQRTFLSSFDYANVRVSSRPTCIARHNFTGRTRCLGAAARKYTTCHSHSPPPLSLSSLSFLFRAGQTWNRAVFFPTSTNNKVIERSIKGSRCVDQFRRVEIIVDGKSNPKRVFPI